VESGDAINEGLVEELVGLGPGGDEEKNVFLRMDNAEGGNGVVGGAVHDYVGIVGVVVLLLVGWWIEDVIEACVLRSVVCTVKDGGVSGPMWQAGVMNGHRASLARYVRDGCHGVVLGI
jgi:hypothetical protein